MHSVFYGSPSRKAQLLIRRPPRGIGEMNFLFQYRQLIEFLKAANVQLTEQMLESSTRILK